VGATAQEMSVSEPVTITEFGITRLESVARLIGHITLQMKLTE